MYFKSMHGLKKNFKPCAAKDERDRNRERDREKEKDRCFLLYMPQAEIEPATFWCIMG